MLSFRPLYLTLVALIFVVVQPVASFPIRTPQWIKNGRFEDLESRGVWKVLENEGSQSGPESPRSNSMQTSSQMKPGYDDTDIERGPPGYHYEPESSPGESVVSVLVPVAPASAQSHRNHHHQLQDIASQDSYPKVESTAAHKMNHYGEVLGHPQAQTNGVHRHEASSFSTASLKLASGHSISFFSYRISLPFLKFAPGSFPQSQLPGIFTTVMVLLAMVWIAIIMIGLVEFGNYLWKRRRAARLALESDVDVHEGLAGGAVELTKMPMRVVVSPGRGTDGEGSQDEEATLLSSGSESDSGSESSVDDYRF